MNFSISARAAGTRKGRFPLIRTKTKLDRCSSIDEARAVPSQRILIVDDSVDSARSLGMLLKALGANVAIAHDGPAALAAIEKSPPNIAILDIGMPGMDGFEVARQIRNQHSLSRMTLVALTGWGHEDDRRRTQEAGFDHHLVKPIDLPALEALLNNSH